MNTLFRYILVALFVVTAVSCAKEEYPFRRGKEVSFVADLGGIESRAIADGLTVNEVAWAVYAAGESSPLNNLWGTMPISNKQAELNIRLATGMSYDVVFFAYYTENPTTKTTIGGEIDPLYYEFLLDQKVIKVDYTNAVANDEKRDCFWYAEQNLKINGPTNRCFVLKRPLAQLNIGVNKKDLDLATAEGYQISASSIKVDSYTQFNLLDGTLSELEPVTILFDKSQIPSYSENTLIVTNDPIEYKYLGTTYILGDNKWISNVEIALYDDTDYEINTLKYTFVPLQRNYRTNIIGSLLTNPHKFTIVVDDNFDGEHNE